MPARGSSDRSDERRSAIIEAAVRRFALRGLYGTSTHDIAADVGISQPYVYRLFTNKTSLFCSAIEHVSEILAQSLVTTASRAEQEGTGIIEAMESSYAALVTDEVLLRFLLQANCALDEPEVVEALRACWAKQVHTLRSAAHASDDAIRRILGSSLLTNVARGLRLEDVGEDWADVLSGSAGDR